MQGAFEHLTARVAGWIDQRLAWFFTNGCKQSLRHDA